MASWAEELKRGLSEAGVAFEAEAEAIRIPLEGGAVIEVAGAEGGYAIVATIPLPGAGEADAVETVCRALGVMASFGVELEYEVDDSLPGYPMLRVTARHEDPGLLASRLLEALKKLASP
ncbi:MAG: hypothetical protein GSR80_000591 [Desulfurococcales archaeon]|nr:hypothetical protein [Desulfurococcales archaeon]